MSEKKERVLTNTKSVSFVYERKEERLRVKKRELEKVSVRKKAREIVREGTHLLMPSYPNAKLIN